MARYQASWPWVIAQACGGEFQEATGPAGADLNADGDGADNFLILSDFAQTGGAGNPATFGGIAGFSNAPAAPPTPVDPTAAFDVEDLVTQGGQVLDNYLAPVANNFWPLRGVGMLTAAGLTQADVFNDSPPQRPCVLVTNVAVEDMEAAIVTPTTQGLMSLLPMEKPLMSRVLRMPIQDSHKVRPA